MIPGQVCDTGACSGLSCNSELPDFGVCVTPTTTTTTSSTTTTIPDCTTVCSACCSNFGPCPINGIGCSRDDECAGNLICKPNVESNFGCDAHFNFCGETRTVPTSCITTISCGEILTSETLESGCPSIRRDGRYAKYYTFTLDSNTGIIIDLISSEYDTYVYLLQGGEAGGSLMLWNNDGGEGSNSHLSRTLSANSYTIEATTNAADTTGSFTVELSC